MSIFTGDKAFEEALRNLPKPGNRVMPSGATVKDSWLTYEGARPQRTQRWRYPTVEDNKKSLDGITWRNLLSFGRQLFINLGPVRGAILEKGTYSVGNAWLPIFKGADKAWGDKATPWLLDWFRNCDVRGSGYDFKTGLFLDSLAIDRDGDIGCLKSQVSKSDRYPQIQAIEAHRIFGRDYDTKIETGPYAGMRIYNGVVLNDCNRPVAFHILGEDPDQDQYISANDLSLFYQPEWSTQGRGISALAHCILDAESFQDITNYLKQQVALDSSLGLNVYNATGSVDLAQSLLLGNNQTGVNPLIAQPGSSGVNSLAMGASEGGIDVQMESIEGGTIRYFRSGSGDKIEALNTNRPSPNVDAFMEKLLRNCFAGLEWAYEFTRDGSKIGGANIRLVNEKIVRSVEKRQAILRRKAHYAVTFALSRAVELRLLPKSSDPRDVFAWDFTLPPQMNVDSGRESMQKREDVRMGLRSRRTDYGERGEDWSQEREQLATEARDLLTKAKAIADEFGVSLEFAVNLIEKQSPNPPPQALSPQEEPTPPDQEPPTTAGD